MCQPWPDFVVLEGFSNERGATHRKTQHRPQSHILPLPVSKWKPGTAITIRAAVRTEFVHCNGDSLPAKSPTRRLLGCPDDLGIDAAVVMVAVLVVFVGSQKEVCC